LAQFTRQKIKVMQPPPQTNKQTVSGSFN